MTNEDNEEMQNINREGQEATDENVNQIVMKRKVIKIIWKKCMNRQALGTDLIEEKIDSCFFLRNFH